MYYLKKNYLSKGSDPVNKLEYAVTSYFGNDTFSQLSIEDNLEEKDWVKLPWFNKKVKDMKPYKRFFSEALNHTEQQKDKTRNW